MLGLLRFELLKAAAEAEGIGFRPEGIEYRLVRELFDGPRHFRVYALNFRVFCTRCA